MASQRISLGIKFVMPPYSTDDMYLITPKKQDAETFWTLLGKPLSHFQGYILLSAWVAAFTDLSNDENFENHHYYAFRVLALVLAAIEHHKKTPIQKVLGFAPSEEEEPDADNAEEFGTRNEMLPEALREEVSAALKRLERLFEVKVGRSR